MPATDANWTRTEIASAVMRSRVAVVEFSTAEASQIERTVGVRFATPGDEPLWQRLVDGEGIQDPDGWQKLAAFVDGPTTMFVRDSHGLAAFRFAHGADLVATISEGPLFEFYVTDDAQRYLLAFNEHDFLIGCGSAKDWILRLRQPSC